MDLPPNPLIISLLVLVFVSLVPAQAAEIDPVVASALDDHVSVTLTLTDGFAEPWKLEALQNGLPLVFLYEIDLIRKRENWFDSLIDSSEIELVATYNSLTREYLLNYRKDRKLVSSENVRSLEELKRRMTTIREDRLFALADRQPRDLRVRARAVLGRRYLFHVIPKPVSTDWETVRVHGRSTP